MSTINSRLIYRLKDLLDLPWKIEIFYHGLGTNAGEVQGIYNKYNSTWDKRVTWTLSEPFSALNWFPCKQSLTDQADSVYVFLSTDNNAESRIQRFTDPVSGPTGGPHTL